MTTVTTFPGTRLLNQLSTYPLLNDTYNQATSYYSWVKSTSSYVAAPLTLAETGLKKAVETSQPVIQKFNGQLNMAEDIACSKLTQLETRYPVVLKPTKEIYDDSKEYIGSSVQPLVQKAVSPISNTYNSVKDYSTKTVSTLAQTRLASKGYTMLEQVVDTADIFTDKYLPGDDNKADDQGKKDLLTKTLKVSSKVQRRMYNKAMKGLQNMKLRTDESIKNLHFTVDLMEYAKTQIQKSKIGDIYGEISEEYAEESKQDMQKDESKTMSNARAYANTIRLTVLATSSVFYKHLSEENQVRITKAKKYTEDLYSQLLKSNLYTELSDTFFVHTRRTLVYVNETLDTVFKYIGQLKEQYLDKKKPLPLGENDEVELKEESVSSSGEESE